MIDNYEISNNQFDDLEVDLVYLARRKQSRVKAMRSCAGLYIMSDRRASEREAAG